MKLSEFLKKYSTLSDDFIDDFGKIYMHDDNDDRNDDFIINLEIICKWLETRKSRLKETLQNTYNKNIDYKVKKEREGKISKSNKEIILLTPDCFKRLCLLSRTKKAEEVRTYYIELEKILDKYKKYIIEGLKKQVKILENNQRESVSTNGAIVYILKSPKDIDGIYRFGKTKDFKERLQNYNSANSDKMEVVLVYETKYATEVERCVIAQIKEARYKKRKDFYQIDKKIIKSLVKSCEKMTMKFKKRITTFMNKLKQNGGNDEDCNLYLYLHKK